MYCFIVNKAAGNGQAIRFLNHIENILLNNNVQYCIRFTEKVGHATEIVQDLVRSRQASVIVAVGGDGTVHEVINGLVGTDIPLGIIPAGSGNDFCKSLDIPLRYEHALQRILNDDRKLLDIGKINSKYFATVAGAGFDGKVAYVTNRSRFKKVLNYIRLGRISYIVGVLKVLSNYKPINVELKIDQQLYSIPNVWLIAVANSPYYAGGMAICPDAKNNDGQLDICVVHEISRWGLLRIFPSVFKGKHVLNSSIKMYRGKEIEILSEIPLMIHGDGESIGQTPTHIHLEPKSLYVV